jgi:hypothetical protein
MMQQKYIACVIDKRLMKHSLDSVLLQSSGGDCFVATEWKVNLLSTVFVGVSEFTG